MPIAELQGPVLNLGSPQTELAPAILAMARSTLLCDRRYVERLERHYWLMREEVERRTRTVLRRAERVGRNNPGYRTLSQA